MIHIRLIVSKIHGVKMVLLCDKTVLIYDKYKWHINKRKKTCYVERNENGTTISLHREILGLTDGIYGDHWNGNGLDNQLSNLRPATHQENQCNRKIQSNNTSGYKGVSWNKPIGKYMTQIRFDGKSIHLGYFDDPKKAHEAYCKKGKELHGEFFNAG